MSEQYQLLIENVKDRINGIPGLARERLIPLDEPGIESIILRDLNRSIKEVEKKTKLTLFPMRLTNYPETPREAYENKSRYEPLNAFVTYEALIYPTFDDLTPEQQAKYILDPRNPSDNLYSSGTLPWDLMTKTQKQYLTSRIIHVPNKAGDEEKLDGKGRSYVKLHHRNLIKIHKFALEIKSPREASAPFYSRTYGENEMKIYREEGGVMLLPLFTQIGMAYGTGNNASSYGLSIARYPQIITVDYSYGFTEIPDDLKDVIAMKTAIRTFENVNIAFTQGLLSYSVQGFSASFGKGLYDSVMERYETRIDHMLNPYTSMVITGRS